MEENLSDAPAATIEILDRLASRHDQLADRVFAAVTAEIGDYRGPSGEGSGDQDLNEFWRDVRSFGDSHIREALRSVRTGGTPSPEALEYVKEVTIRRVDQGVPLDAILHAFRVGHRVVWAAVLDEADSLPEGRSAVVELTLPFMRYVDAVSTCIASTYATQQHRLEAAADRAAQDLLNLMLSGGDGAEDAARDAGIEIDRPHLFAIATATTDGDRGALRMIADELREAFGGTALLVVADESEVTCLVPLGEADPGAVADRCADALGPAFSGRPIHHRVGISLAFRGIAEMAIAEQQARSAHALADPARPVLYLGQMSVLDYLLAREDRVASSLIPDAVRDLATSGSAMDRALVETLVAYVDSDMNVQRTAAALPAHPNTVHYRLNRLEEKTGHSHRDVRQVTELAMAIRMVRADVA
ncbi:MAG: helix-turn-helix domain-containing protein [Solirubrobacterales bacterium]|nr:helix-turn-helix domain-containing protein [Solirubrobacterales bacterium]OJU93758.1 MAG: hypothetical protein BGO23_14155 [Solirubrobacterales bacterium 67-14]